MTVGLTGGVPAFIRVGSTSTTTEGTFYLNIKEDFSLFFASSLCGPGVADITANIIGGPPNGGYFMCVTTNPGAFPNGWFYGLDPLFSEVIAQVQTPGFVGPLSPTGTFTLGPICGLPTGVITLYGVALGFATPTIDTPIAATPPTAISP